jgi:mono/diheme cytochrome c family protein
VSYEPQTDDQLSENERNALRAWAECDVPTDFAERIAGRVAAEHEAKRVHETPSWAAWWIGMIAAAAAIVLALGLVFSGDSRTDDLAALRADAEQVLLRECTPCHVGEGQGAEPDALAVFDLRDDAWQDALSSAQLAMVVDRVAERGDATGVRRYVDAELGRRRR